MVDGLKLLVTDGRIILVILQVKPFIKRYVLRICCTDWKSRNHPSKDLIMIQRLRLTQ